MSGGGSRGETRGNFLGAMAVFFFNTDASCLSICIFQNSPNCTLRVVFFAVCKFTWSVNKVNAVLKRANSKTKAKQVKSIASIYRMVSVSVGIVHFGLKEFFMSAVCQQGMAGGVLLDRVPSAPRGLPAGWSGAWFRSWVGSTSWEVRLGHGLRKLIDFPKCRQICRSKSMDRS